MKAIQTWLDEYGASHQNPLNKTIHWICVPLIFFSIIGMFYSLRIPFSYKGYQLNMAIVMLLAVTAYYALLSRTLWVGMFLFSILCLAVCYLLVAFVSVPLWGICIGIFVLAWIVQFYGHKVEGAKPSFLKDLQFLLIGPAWLMSFIYKNLGIGY